MNEITSKISFDLMKPDSPPIIHAVQGESYTRSIQLSIFCDGTPWIIPENTLIAMRYGRVDLTGGYYDTLPNGSQAWSYEDNTITIVLAPQMMSAAGAVLAQVEMIHEEQVLCTFSFQIMVSANPAAGICEPETYINWLQWMETQLDAHVQTMLESGSYTGPAGPQGDPASVTGFEVVYQAGTSATAVPGGVWSSVIPHVPAGQYLWTRTTVIFNDTEPVTFYSVTRYGIDGSGAVSTVAGVSPDANGNVALDAASVKALALAGGTMEGPIHMNGQTLSGLNAPEANDQAANMGFVNAQVKKAAPRNLLDNSDFTRFVAQAGIGGNHGTKAYAGDRWILDSGSVTGTANENDSGYSGITLNGTIRQILENPPAVGTAAIEMVSGTAEVTYANGEVTVTSSGGVIKNVALYEGTYTAEALPKYQPKSYSAELAECKRYYQRIGKLGNTGAIATGYCYNATSVRFVTSIAPMRKNPTVTLVSTENMPVVITGGSGISKGALTFTTNLTKDAQHLILNVTVSGATANAPAVLCCNSSVWFELSADL